MDVLVIDVGGHRVKILAKGQEERRAFESGPKMTVDESAPGPEASGDGSGDRNEQQGSPSQAVTAKVPDHEEANSRN